MTAALRLALCSLVLAGPVAAQVIHVDADALGADDGTSWSDAYNTLQDALAVASSGAVLRVAEGTYEPDQGASQTPGNRTESFLVPAGVTIAGGYAGDGQPDPDLRDPDTYVTTLDGDLLGDDTPGFGNRTDNSYHVVSVSGSSGVAVRLDGLTIRGGHAVSPGPQEPVGAGLYLLGGDLELVSCTITDCLAGNGGGAYVATEVFFAASGSMEIFDCEFIGNEAIGEGGGLFASDLYDAFEAPGGFSISNSIFRDNVAGSGGGAHITGVGSIRQCRFEGNAADSGGGLVLFVQANTDTQFCSPSVSTLADCVFLDNVAAEGGGALIQPVGCSSPPVLVVAGCGFFGNLATAGEGGGLHASVLPFFGETALIRATHTVFSGNQSVGGGAGALIVGGTDIAVASCTFFDNTSAALTDAGGLQTDGTVANGIFRGNTNASGTGESAQVSPVGALMPTVDYCSIQGLTGALGGTGNVDVLPLFVDADGADDVAGTEDDDVRLSAGSRCIDAGGNAELLVDEADLDCDGDAAEPTPLDHDGLMRLFDDPGTIDTGAGTAPIVDMGAHEFGSSPPVTAWADLGNALAGTSGLPVFTSTTVGPFCPGAVFTASLTSALPGATALLVIGLTRIDAGFKGGVLVPSVDIILPLPVSVAGDLVFPVTTPDAQGLTGFVLFWQYWIPDPAGVVGYAASNALQTTFP